MSAERSLPPSVPPLLSLLDDHFDARSLERVLGIAGPEAVELARRALVPPLADFLSRPGKELRARFVEHAFAIAVEVGPACACARLPRELPQIVEMLHAGSLIVDDVEDEALTRRGAPALHRTHGVAAAINAGSWLYFWPQVLLGGLGLDAASLAAMHRRLSLTLLRCHHGQALDLAIRVTELTRAEIPSAVAVTTRLKTGSLFELAAALGAIAAHAPSPVERALATFGREVGTVLQIVDDVSSILSPARREKAHEDLVFARPPWPWAWLADELEPRAFAALQHLARAVRKGDVHPDLLVERLRASLAPDARRRARERLDLAIASLRGALGEHPAIDRLVRDVRTLEHAHA